MGKAKPTKADRGRGKSANTRLRIAPEPKPKPKRKPKTKTKDTQLLKDEHHARGDRALVEQAVRRRWPVAEEKRPTIVRRLIGIIEKTTVEVMTREGPAVLDGPADANAIAACRVLALMEQQNQTDELKGIVETHEHRHVHVHTGNTGADGPDAVIDPEAERRRLRLSELAARLGARELVIDGQTVETGTDTADTGATSPTPEPVGESDGKPV